jgi:hypothetical protein
MAFSPALHDRLGGVEDLLQLFGHTKLLSGLAAGLRGRLPRDPAER